MAGSNGNLPSSCAICLHVCKHMYLYLLVCIHPCTQICHIRTFTYASVGARSRACLLMCMALGRDLTTGLTPGGGGANFFFPLYSIFWDFLCILCTSAAPQRPAHGTVSSQMATHLRTDRVCRVLGRSWVRTQDY